MALDCLQLSRTNHQTRIGEHFAAIINNIIANMADAQPNYGHDLTPFSDHFPQLQKGAVFSYLQKLHSIIRRSRRAIGNFSMA